MMGREDEKTITNKESLEVKEYLVIPDRIVEWMHYVHDNQINIVVSKENILEKYKPEEIVENFGRIPNQPDYFKVEERFHKKYVRCSLYGYTPSPLLIGDWKTNTKETIYGCNDFYKYLPDNYTKRIKDIFRETYNVTFQKEFFFLKLVGSILSFINWKIEPAYYFCPSPKQSVSEYCMSLVTERITGSSETELEKIIDKIITPALKNRKFELDAPLAPEFMDILDKLEVNDYNKESFKFIINFLILTQKSSLDIIMKQQEQIFKLKQQAKREDTEIEALPEYKNNPLKRWSDLKLYIDEEKAEELREDWKNKYSTWRGVYYSLSPRKKVKLTRNDILVLYLIDTENLPKGAKYRKAKQRLNKKLVALFNKTSKTKPIDQHNNIDFFIDRRTIDKEYREKVSKKSDFRNSDIVTDSTRVF